jgi:RNA polymerase sigma-70 factor (ECF subfamily)
MKVVCMRYAPDADTAEDLVQEGFIKVFEKVVHFNMQGSFEGWVRRIMVNNAIDYIRRNKILHVSMEDEHVQRKADIAGDSLEEDEPDYLNITPSQILRAMQELSPAYRTVFNLYVMENYSHQEIAEELGINIGTSKSNLAKARQNLKKILEIELAKAHEAENEH